MAIRQGRHGRMAGAGATARLLPDRLAEFPGLPICGSARASRIGMAVLAIRQWPDHQALDAGTRRRFPSARPAGPAGFKHVGSRQGKGAIGAACCGLWLPRRSRGQGAAGLRGAGGAFMVAKARAAAARLRRQIPDVGARKHRSQMWGPGSRLGRRLPRRPQPRPGAELIADPKHDQEPGRRRRDPAAVAGRLPARVQHGPRVVHHERHHEAKDPDVLAPARHAHARLPWQPVADLYPPPARARPIRAGQPAACWWRTRCASPPAPSPRSFSSSL